MRNIENSIAGFIGFADDIRSRIEAVGEDETPTQWTPEHVGKRLTEAFDVLSRYSVRVGPKKYGNGWPAMIHEFSDMVDAQARALADKERQQAITSRPTSDEVSRMDEALRWSMNYLADLPMPADALMLWAYAKALHRDMDGMLHQRKKRAMALASGMMKRANADPHHGDCRSLADQWRAALRRQLAREVMDALNAKLAEIPKDEHEAAIKSAHEDMKARCKTANCLPYRFRPRDAMPNRVMTRTWLDHNRKIAAAAIAKGLRRAAVPVR